MKQKRRAAKRILLMAAALLLAVSTAFSETAKVVTPGGAMNMRKKPDKKAPLVEKVQNGALVEADEIGEEWAHITWQGKTGYVMTEYLRPASSAVGKTLYAEGGVLLLRAEANESAPILRLLPADEPVTVQAVAGEFYEVTYAGESGFVPLAALIDQRDTPASEISFVPMTGLMLSTQSMKARPDAAGENIHPISLGDEVTVCLPEAGWCLIEKDGNWGYVPLSAVQLTGLQTMTGEPPRPEGKKDLTAEKALAQAQKALKKQFKAFQAAEYMPVYDLVSDGDQNLYRFTFIDAQGKYGYAAYLDAATGKAQYLADFTAFGYGFFGKTRFLSAGDEKIHITVEPGMVSPGETMQVTVESENAVQYQYDLTRKGETLTEKKQVPYGTAYFRPRESGVYRLKVTAFDAAGQQSQAETCLWVTKKAEEGEYSVAEEEAPAPSFTLYSQMDGWWLDKHYSKKSNLQVSGCAIFTLAHALQLLGRTEEGARPENLAVTYVACLVEGGTLNASLIGRAAKEFDYATKAELIKSPVEIRERFEKGAVFSFSVVKGHIALASGVSTDGEMVRIIDSAPSATMERIKDASLYIEDENGGFRAVEDLMDVPGAKYYLESGAFGGLEYYLSMDYVARRGVRLIQPR